MKTRSKGFMAALAVVIALGLFAQSSAFGVDYIITDLSNTFGGTMSEAYGINNNDEVVGRASFPGDIIYHAFLYSGGVMTDLGVSNCVDPNGKSLAYRINDSGQIAGLSCFGPPSFATRAFLYSDGLMEDLGTLGGTNSEAWGINNSGHVAGSAAMSGDGSNHAFIYRGGVMTDLGVLGGKWSWGRGINDSDEVVGWSQTSNATHAFLWSNGVMTDLTPTLTGWSYAYDINNSGQIVGAAYFPGTDNHAFLYSQGVLTDLGSFGGPVGSEAWGINNFGQIVGWSYIPYGCYGNCIPRAFLYDNDVMTDLNDLLPQDSGWVVNYALDINDKGRIVGVGTINGQSHAFLMTPLPPPDLFETAVSNPPATAVINESFSVTDTVLNQGDSTAGVSTTQYYLSTDTIKSNTDTFLIGNRSVPSLGSDATSNGTVTVTIPPTTALGTYYLLACADDLTQVAESSETNNCIASNTTVQIQTSGPFTLLSPSAGEVIFSGTIYTIQWAAPSEVAKFKVSYSMDKGTTWIPVTKNYVVGRSYPWTVPKPIGNKKKCLAKVIGYNSAGVRLGADKSNAPFTIEVVKITLPNGGESLKSGTSYKITWATNGTKASVSKVRLYYTKDRGTKWLQIPAKITSNPGYYDWMVSTVRTVKVNCKVKVALLDASGNSLGSDVSDGYFTITP